MPECENSKDGSKGCELGYTAQGFHTGVDDLEQVYKNYIACEKGQATRCLKLSSNLKDLKKKTYSINEVKNNKYEYHSFSIDEFVMAAINPFTLENSSKYQVSYLQKSCKGGDISACGEAFATPGSKAKEVILPEYARKTVCGKSEDDFANNSPKYSDVTGIEYRWIYRKNCNKSVDMGH